MSLVAVGALGGWGMSATFVESAKAVDSMRRDVEVAKLSLDQAKAALVGSYTVTGTDPDGVPYKRHQGRRHLAGSVGRA